MFLEGSGTFDLPRWKKAVQIASQANPGTRLVLKGHWMFSKWVESGVCPRVREVDGAGWDGLSSEGAPAFLLEPFHPREGYTCEVVLIHGDPLRVCFRAHHAVMDGRGTMTWAEDIFRALRGEQPIGSCSRLTEFEVARSFQKKGRIPPPQEFIAPTGMPEARERGEWGIEWRRTRIPGRYKNLLGQVAILLAQSAWLHDEGKVRFGITVDLRPRQKGLRSVGNVANPIYLDTFPGMTPEDAAQDVTRQLQEKRDGMLYWADRLVRYMPMMYLRRLIEQDVARSRATGRYRNSGLLTNIGTFPVEHFHGGGFKSEYFWGLPAGTESIPIFIGMTYSRDDTSLMTTVPPSLASRGRLDAVVEHLRQGLVPEHSHGNKGRDLGT